MSPVVVLRLSIWSCVALAMPALAGDAVDLVALNRIVDEAVNRSELPRTAAHLTDRIGARLPNSPQMREAERWTQERFREWGLRHVRAEGFEFGRGWSIERSSVRMIEPRARAMRSIPIAWTPATNGAVAGEVIVAPIESERDFVTWQGRLRGKTVMLTRPDTAQDALVPPFKRLSDDELRRADEYPLPRHVPADYRKRLQQAEFETRREAFLVAEGALLWIVKAPRDGGLVEGATYGHHSQGYKVGATPRLPGIELAAEDYRLLARLAKSGVVPKLEIVSDVSFHDEDAQAYNIIAELPGRDSKAGYVLAGAHLDSWVASDGAADNAAGVAVVMEAARVLSKLGVRPKRAIHFALWNAEEPGLLGSTAYVERHLATRAPVKDKSAATLNPYFSRSWLQRWPVAPLVGHDQLVAYFNLDNGSGKIRGINAEGNFAAIPIFKQWLQPLASMGASTVAARRAFGTDHQFMQAVGIPGFQFIQDPLDYDSRIHHTTLDTYDHLKIEDLKQAAVVLASVLLSAADSDEPLPRMPLPTEPLPTDPFLYDEDAR